MRILLVCGLANLLPLVILPVPLVAGAAPCGIEDCFCLRKPGYLQVKQARHILQPFPYHYSLPARELLLIR